MNRRLDAPLRLVIKVLRSARARLRGAGLLASSDARERDRILIARSELFDARWYTKRYPDVGSSGIDPALHYLLHGGAEGRDPSPRFGTAAYYKLHPDVAQAGMNPLVHYLRYGRAEKRATAPAFSEGIEDGYAGWVKRFDNLTKRDVRLMKQHIASDRRLPALLVIIRFDAGNENAAEKIVRDLSKQLYDRWHALFVLDSSCTAAAMMKIQAALADRKQFTIFKTERGATAESLVDALPGYEFVFVTAPNVVLREHALYAFAAAAALHPDARVVYSDHDFIGPTGERYAPAFKPSFSPELFRHIDYVGPVALLKADPERTIVKQFLGGVPVVKAALEFAALRNVVHTPFTLYHEASARAAQLPALKGSRRPSPDRTPVLEREPDISIIIPTRDNLGFLEGCIKSIESKTNYPPEKIELIIVDNGSREIEALRYFEELEERIVGSKTSRVRVLHDARKFNYSKLNNAAAKVARGEILVLLNNDTLVNDRNWLRKIAYYATQKDVGAVGAKLLYEDRTIQHGGIILGVQGVAAHAQARRKESDLGGNAFANFTREISAVTGACLAMRKTVFDEIGGLDEKLGTAFNDVLLCLSAAKLGYRNIYIADPLLFHLESKTRGFDDTPEKIDEFRREAEYARKAFRGWFKDDPYYSPNFSLNNTYDLAFPPRRTKPWARVSRSSGEPLRVLMLSCTHEVGHGVATVLALQARHLAENGFSVYVGGPQARVEVEYPGCIRVDLHSAQEAANFAVEFEIDCVIAHTMPFFSVFRLLGDRPRSIVYDYGEPPADLFPDADQRKLGLVEKKFCSSMADRVYAISEAVKSEMDVNVDGVIPLANEHLSVWSGDLRGSREKTRRAYGWTDKIVVLNVCRFHQMERLYKGTDTYAAVRSKLKPNLRDRVVFVLCGKAEKSDVREMKALGLEVFANVTDAEMIALYAAADMYMNFSKWEGYNLGIAQALAMGLPVIASDIPAHREFPAVFTSNSTPETVARATKTIEGLLAGTIPREPVVIPWKPPLQQFQDIVSQLCAEDLEASPGTRHRAAAARHTIAGHSNGSAALVPSTLPASLR